ncbi:hypothetical protein [Ruegeria sp. HKCCA4008]|uniref:hypothetical protein n=1 Tax=Ruegeria sp. HKCCA4008 TaxID=2682999 RepID=UPI001489E264|nr:hypothetical protein [Ruegeria sp. HKCCA4008]
MKNISVTKEQAREAVERLLDAVRADSGVSLRLARFILSTHGAHSDVDFDLFPSLDNDNLEAAHIAMRYSLFERRYELPLDWEEAMEIRDYWEERSKAIA